MDPVKFETEFTYEKAKESIEAIILIGLIGHFTGYRPPNNDEETENTMASVDRFLNKLVKEILEQSDEEERHEIVSYLDEETDVFKKELFDLMKRMETV